MPFSTIFQLSLVSQLEPSGTNWIRLKRAWQNILFAHFEFLKGDFIA
jgi:hypothetical protein